MTSPDKTDLYHEMMDDASRAGILKRAILLFWAAWISLVAVMNGFNLLKVAGILPAGWRFASENYKAITDLTARYGTPHAVGLLLFIGIIAWEAGCAVLLWWACRRFGHGHRRRWRTVNLGFVGLFVLFAGFILGDEIFQNFTIERDHRGIAVLLLASVMALHLLPDRIRDV